VAYLCLIAYVAAIYVRPAEIFSSWAGFPFVEVLTSVAFAVAGFSYLAEPRKFWDLPHDKFVLGVWFAIVVSNLSSGWLGGAFQGFSHFLRMAFYYFLMRFTIRDHRQFRGFVYTLIAANVFLAMSGIVQFHTGTGWGGVPLNQGRIQGSGIFNDPNDLAFTLVMVVPFLLAEATDTARGLTSRLVALGLLAPIVCAIFYTDSRGGMVGLGVVLTAHSFRRYGRMAAAVTAGVLVAAALLGGPSRLSMLDSGEESAQMRIQAWGAALVMFKSDPLFGVGYDRFSEFHEIVAHNSFVHTFAELGILGAFFWVGMCYWLVKGLLPRRSQSAPIEIDRFEVPVLLSVVGVLASSCFLSQQYGVVLFTLVGMGACYVSIAKAHGADIEARTSPREVQHIALITLAGIAATYIAVSFLSRPSGP